VIGLATPQATDASALAHGFTQQVNHALTADHFTGSILLEKGGRILLKKSYGLAYRNSYLENSSQTKFPIFGLTDTLSAAGIMKLQEDGELSVQDTLCSFLAACPAAWQPVTLEELLNGTSGIADYPG
jgi:CubicO group peptidase (beta-lactamase class C family)